MACRPGAGRGACCRAARAAGARPRRCLGQRLRRASYAAAPGAYSGAYVANLTARAAPSSAGAPGTPRILASNTKLFTTSAALARYGTEGTLGTEVLGRGQLDDERLWRGDLYLRGGGDPTFGTARFTARAYGGGATVERPRQAARGRPGSSA